MQRLIQKNKLQKIIASLILIILIMNIFMPSYILAEEDNVDDLADFIWNKWGGTFLYTEDVAKETADILKGTTGVVKVTIEQNGDGDYYIVIEHDVSTPGGIIKEDIKTAITYNVVCFQPSEFANSITNEENMKFVETITENPGEEDPEMTDEEKLYQEFKQWLGLNYSMGTQTIDMLWQWYEDSEHHMGLDSNRPAVIVDTDDDGHITNIELNLTPEQKQAAGINAQAESQIQDNQTNDEDEDDESGVFGLLFSPFTSLIVGIADSVNWILQSAIIGGDDSAAATKIRSEAVAYMEENNAAGKSDLPIITIKRSGIDNSAGGFLGIGSTYRIGTVRLTPVEIFAGRVTALNANFFKDTTTDSDMLGGDEKSIINDLKGVVSSWYIAIRNIATVGLLSVLLYIGIRIIISSSANDKAKYKQFFEDWLIALCLIFFMHYIMSFTMTISEQVTNMLANVNSGLNTDGSIRQCIIMLTEDDGSEVQETGSTRTWYSNFTNVARIKVQYDSLTAKLGYTVIYVCLTAYTVYFTVIYLKRVLMLAFYTLMAPAVALTYPIDKMKDGKAQAFNFWLKDYIFYALLQPLHMILYTVFVSSAIDLAANNMLYAIVAMAFIVPAEKIIKQMFGIKGNTEDRVGGFMGGAVAGSMFSNLKKLQKPSGGGSGKDAAAHPNANKIPTFKNENVPDTLDVMAQEASALPQDAITTAAAGAAGGAAGAALAEGGSPNVTTRDNGAPEEQPQNNGFDTTLTPETMAELEAQGIGPGRYLPQGAPQQGNPPQTPRPQISNTPTTREKKLRGEKGKFGRLKNYVNNRVTDAGGWGSIAAKAGKGLVKGYVKAGTAVAMGAAGLGIGAVGGDLSDALKGMGAGAAAGSYIGGNAGRRVVAAGEYVNNTRKGNTGLGRAYAEIWNGESAEDIEKQQYVSAYMNSKENRDRYIDKHSSELKDLSSKDREMKIKAGMQDEAKMSYDTGITDYKTIREAVKLEKSMADSFGGDTPDQIEANKERAHNIALTTAKLSEDYDKKTFTSRKNLQDAKDSFADRLLTTPGSNLTEAQAKAQADIVFNNMKKMKGL